MSALAHRTGSIPARRGPLIAHASIQRGTLWLLGASSGLALIEPSPYEFVFLLVVFAFLLTGIKLSQKLLPLIVLLLLYNLGGVFSLIPWMDEAPSVRFTAVSVYLMITSIVVAAIMAEDAASRIETLRKGWTIAAWYAATAAILGYFDVAGLGSIFSYASRASGTFKDPNVLGPFLVLPIAFTLQHVLTGRTSLLRGLLLMSVPLLALFLTFSRGAWGHLVVSLMLMTALTFLDLRECAAAGSDRRAFAAGSRICSGGAAGGALLRIDPVGVRDPRLAGAELRSRRHRPLRKPVALDPAAARRAQRLRAAAVPLHLPRGPAQRLHQRLRVLWLARRLRLAGFDRGDPPCRVATGVPALAAADAGDRDLVSAVRDDPAGRPDRHRSLAAFLPADRSRLGPIRPCRPRLLRVSRVSRGTCAPRHRRGSSRNPSRSSPRPH